MGEIETSGPRALELLQRLLSNDVAKLDVGGAQYSVLCRDDGGVLDDLFTYRLGDDRYLTVTNAANHERDLAWFREHAGGFDVEVADRLDDYAMLAVQGPEARAIVAGLRRRRAAAADAHARASRSRGAEALVCGTGYTGEDGVEILVAPDGAPALWEALLDAGATPAGLGARDTLRLEVCFHLYGNDLVDRPQPDRGRPRLVLQGGDGLHRRRGRRRGARERHRREAGPVRAHRARHPAPGQPGARRGGERAGVVTSGTFSPSLERGIGMAYVRAELAEPGPRSRSTCAASAGRRA